MISRSVGEGSSILGTPRRKGLCVKLERVNAPLMYCDIVLGLCKIGGRISRGGLLSFLFPPRFLLFFVEEGIVLVSSLP